MKQRNFILYFLLTMVTCGLYGIYFWYMFVVDLNKVCAEKVPNDKPSPNYIVVALLTIITCGIYYYVWLYGQGNRMSDAAKGYGMEFHETGTTYLLWFLLGAFVCGLGPIFGVYLMIRNMNTLAENYNREHGVVI